MAEEKERPTEDDIARERLGPQGVPGEPAQGKMTKKENEQTPKSGKFDGHVA